MGSSLSAKDHKGVTYQPTKRTFWPGVHLGRSDSKTKVVGGGPDMVDLLRYHGPPSAQCPDNAKPRTCHARQPDFVIPTLGTLANNA